jgi:hypothetical protein
MGYSTSPPLTLFIPCGLFKGIDVHEMPSYHRNPYY